MLCMLGILAESCTFVRKQQTGLIRQLMPLLNTPSLTMASSTASSLLSMIPHSTKLSPDLMRKIWEVTVDREAREQWPLVMAEFMGLLDRQLGVEEFYEGDGGEGHAGCPFPRQSHPGAKGGSPS